MRFFACLLALVLAAPNVLAGTITVGPPGSGSDYNLLGPAVAAAVAGDTILVAAGTYLEPVPFEVGKPLTILGDGNTSTEVILASSVWGGTSPSLLFRDTPAGQPMRISGISIRAALYPSLRPTTIEIRNCKGPVLMQGVVKGLSSSVDDRLNLVVTNSDFVVIEDCAFEGHAVIGDCGNPAPDPVAAIKVVGSTFYMHSSFAKSGAVIDGCFVSKGVAGLELFDSSAFVSDSWIEGSSGTPTLSGQTFGCMGIHQNGSSPLLLFGSTTVKGGDGGVLPLSPSWTQGGSALELDAPDLVTASPDVTFLGGMHLNGTTAPPIIYIGGTLTTLLQRLGTLTAIPNITAAGGSFSLVAGGERASFVLPFVATDVSPLPLPLAGVSGSLLIEPVGAALLPAVTLDPTGAATLSLSVPFQSLTLTPAGTFSTSNVTQLSVL